MSYNPDTLVRDRGLAGADLDMVLLSHPPPYNIRELNTYIREARTATGSRMFPFLAWFNFCPFPRTGKALVDDLTLQTRWRENAPKRGKFNFRLLYVAQRRQRRIYACDTCVLMLNTKQEGGREGGGGG